VVRAFTHRPPVVGTWYWGNGVDHTGWDVHASTTHRYAYDLVILRGGKSFGGSKEEAALDNSKFFCWDQPVYCVADGVVYAAEDTFADHLPWLENPPADANFAIIQHSSNEFSFYLHLQQGSLSVHPGDTVHAGDVIGRVGNSGWGSEPHLHYAYAEIDATGRLHVVPAQFQDLRSVSNDTVTAVPATGTYTS
jgi:hypothetical protein